MKLTFVSLVVGSGGLILASSAAHAQEASTSSIVEGPGYEVSDSSVFHPSVGAEAGITDNVYYDDNDKRVSGIFRLVAEGAIANKRVEDARGAEAVIEGEEEAAPAQRAMDFRFGGRLAYTEYLSGDNVVRSQRNLGADLNAGVVIAPEGTVAFKASDRFIRDTRPTNFYSYDGTNRISNALSLGLQYQPGGRTMSGGIRWENQIDYFEDGDQRFANRMINAFHARYEWAFFPYSKAFADVSYGFIGQFGSEGGAIDPIKRSAQPIRGGAGIATAITELFTVKAHVGWAHAGYAGGTGYNSPVFGTEIGYRYSPVGRAVFVYNYDHRDSIAGDYYRDHHFGAHVDQQLGRIVGTVGGEFRLRAYDGIPMEIGLPTRDDVVLGVNARANYVFRDWLAAVAEYRTESVITDYRTMYGGELDNPGFTRTEVTAGVRAAF